VQEAPTIGNNNNVAVVAAALGVVDAVVHMHASY